MDRRMRVLGALAAVLVALAVVAAPIYAWTPDEGQVEFKPRLDSLTEPDLPEPGSETDGAGAGTGGDGGRTVGPGPPSGWPYTAAALAIGMWAGASMVSLLRREPWWHMWGEWAPAYGRGVLKGIGESLVWVAGGLAGGILLAILIVTFAGAAAVTLTTALIIVGLVAGVVGLVLAFYQRSQEQRAARLTVPVWMTAGVAILDVVGVSFALEGLLGVRLLTLEKLPPEQAGQHLGMGLVQVFTLGLGGRKLGAQRAVVPETVVLQPTKVSRVGHATPAPQLTTSPPSARNNVRIRRPRSALHSTTPSYRPRYRSDQLSHLPRFSDEVANHLPAGVSMEEFHRVRLKPTDTVTTEEVTFIKFMRETVPPVQPETIMQKVIKPEHIDQYLASEDPWTTVTGYVSRAQDVTDLRTVDDLFEGLRLDYNYSPFVDAEYVGVIRFRAVTPEKYEIPYGGTNAESLARMGGQIREDYPFTGNGFTASKTRTIAEYKIRVEIPLTDGDELWVITRDGQQIFVGVFDEAAGRVVPVSSRGGGYN